MPRIDGRAPLDIETATRQHFHWHRVIRGPCGGETQLLDAQVALASEHPQSVHVGVFALRGTHADRSEALQQFARIEPLLHGVLQILDLQVLVEVDEILGSRVIDDRKRVRWASACARHLHEARCAEAGMRGGLRTGAPAVLTASIEVVNTVQAPGGKHTRRQLERNELLQLWQESSRTPSLRQQLRGRRPADAH